MVPFVIVSGIEERREPYIRDGPDRSAPSAESADEDGELASVRRSRSLPSKSPPTLRPAPETEGPCSMSQTDPITLAIGLRAVVRWTRTSVRLLLASLALDLLVTTLMVAAIALLAGRLQLPSELIANQARSAVLPVVLGVLVASFILESISERLRIASGSRIAVALGTDIIRSAGAAACSDELLQAREARNAILRTIGSSPQVAQVLMRTVTSLVAVTRSLVLLAIIATQLPGRDALILASALGVGIVGMRYRLLRSRIEREASSEATRAFVARLRDALASSDEDRDEPSGDLHDASSVESLVAEYTNARLARRRTRESNRFVLSGASTIGLAVVLFSGARSFAEDPEASAPLLLAAVLTIRALSGAAVGALSLEPRLRGLVRAIKVRAALCRARTTEDATATIEELRRITRGEVETTAEDED